MEGNTEMIYQIGNVLWDHFRPLKERFRALFTLRNIGGRDAIYLISRCFTDSSELLKHECAFCLGQMQDAQAVPILISVLNDEKQEIVVRHEAAEALGAISWDSSTVNSALKNHMASTVPQIAQSCDLALQRIAYLKSEQFKQEILSKNPYNSIDPAPPSTEQDLDKLETILLNSDMPLFERYRAMFALRNIGSNEAATIIAKGLKCEGDDNILFRHEIAYVLGQMQNFMCRPQLIEALSNKTESAMVRHEAAEAIGSIAEEDSRNVLETFKNDEEPLVKESCIVALDICEYENLGQFQYANTMSNMNNAQVFNQMPGGGNPQQMFRQNMQGNGRGYNMFPGQGGMNQGF